MRWWATMLILPWSKRWHLSYAARWSKSITLGTLALAEKPLKQDTMSNKKKFKPRTRKMSIVDNGVGCMLLYCESTIFKISYISLFRFHNNLIKPSLNRVNDFYINIMGYLLIFHWCILSLQSWSCCNHSHNIIMPKFILISRLIFVDHSFKSGILVGSWISKLK